MEQIAYIGLGSNLGDREVTLRQAIMMMDELTGVEVTALSHLLETDPVGGPAGQGRYLNGVAQAKVTVSPQEVLAGLQEIEQALGRNRLIEERWGPRTCDLDLLLMGDLVWDTPDLVIPHPRMHLRKFVLEALAEIAPAVRHPVLKKTAAEMLADLLRT